MAKENPWVFLSDHNFDQNYDPRKTENKITIPHRDVATIFFVEATEEYDSRHDDESLSWDWDFPFFPARSSLLDITTVSINGWWVEVRPMLWQKRSGFFTLDRRIFDSVYHADFYVPIYLQRVKQKRSGKYSLSGFDGKILGYLTYEMAQDLKGVYDKNHYAIFVNSPDYRPCLPLDDLFGTVSEKPEVQRQRPVLGEKGNEVIFSAYDFNLDKMPEEIFFRILSSEESAQQFISARERLEAGIDAWQAEEIKKAED